MYDAMPWQFGLVLSLILFLALLWVHYNFTGAFKDYFAKRRHVRRMRQYMRNDVIDVNSLYPQPIPVHGRRSKKRTAH